MSTFTHPTTISRALVDRLLSETAAAVAQAKAGLAEAEANRESALKLESEYEAAVTASEITVLDAASGELIGVYPPGMPTATNEREG